jgi:hypothetical protein
MPILPLTTVLMMNAYYFPLTLYDTNDRLIDE